MIRDRLDKYTKIINNHWLYMGRRGSNGYGIVKYFKKQIPIHRLSAHLYLNLDLDSPLMALHKTSCPYKNCWNPDCLYIGTHMDNMNDIKSKNVCHKCNRPYDRVMKLKDGQLKRRCSQCHNKYMREYRHAS